MPDEVKPFGFKGVMCVLAAILVIGCVVSMYFSPLMIKEAEAEISVDSVEVNVTETKNGYGLYIDDAFIAASEHCSAICDTLDTVAAQLAVAYGAPLGVHSVTNKVNVVNSMYSKDAFVDAQVLSALLGVNNEVVVFEVYNVKGENTGVELKVCTKLNSVVNEVIEKPVVQNSTDLLENGVVITVDDGKDGVANNTYSLSYINGELSEKVLCSTTVVEEPVAKEQWCGTDSGATLLSADALFALPYDGRISSPYGYRVLWGNMEKHNGIDFVALEGTCYGDPIYAAHDGIVSYAGWRGGYGQAVIIEHTQSLTSLYAHCSKLLVEQGQYVRKGQPIALIGNTGRVTGPHLHYSMFKDGVLCDPTPYLDWSNFKG